MSIPNLAEDIPELKWQDQGACSRVLPKEFVNANWLARPNSNAVKTAKRVCNEICPVRDICLAWILQIEKKQGAQSGVYGGYSDFQRRAFKPCIYRNCTIKQNRELGKNFQFCSLDHQRKHTRFTLVESRRKAQTDYHMKGSIVRDA